MKNTAHKTKRNLDVGNEVDRKNILDQVRGMWRDKKGIDALIYQKKLRKEWDGE